MARCCGSAARSSKTSAIWDTSAGSASVMVAYTSATWTRLSPGRTIGRLRAVDPAKIHCLRRVPRRPAGPRASALPPASRLPWMPLAGPTRMGRLTAPCRASGSPSPRSARPPVQVPTPPETCAGIGGEASRLWSHSGAVTRRELEPLDPAAGNPRGGPGHPRQEREARGTSLPSRTAQAYDRRRNESEARIHAAPGFD
jgi:hypothetical protein